MLNLGVVHFCYALFPSENPHTQKCTILILTVTPIL